MKGLPLHSLQQLAVERILDSPSPRQGHFALIGAGEMLEKGINGGPLPRIIIDDQELFPAEVSIGDTKSVEFCYNFLAGRKICNSYPARADDLLNYESYHSFTVAIAIPTLLGDVSEELERDLVAIDKGVDLNFMFDNVYRVRPPFVVDDDFLESKVVLADKGMPINYSSSGKASPSDIFNAI